MCKFIMFYLGIMASPQLLRIVIARLMLLFLWQLSSGEDLRHNPNHDIILKNDYAFSFQYFHRLALCQRCTVLILCLFMLLGGFFFYCVVKCKTTSLYDFACYEVEVSSPYVKILAFWRTLVVCISPWNSSVAFYLLFWVKLWMLQRYLWHFLTTVFRFF